MKIIGMFNYEDIVGFDIVVIIVGIVRKLGMSCDDFVFINEKIMRSVICEIVKYFFDCIIVVLINFVDVMIYVVYKELGFLKECVIG